MLMKHAIEGTGILTTNERVRTLPQTKERIDATLACSTYPTMFDSVLIYMSRAVLLKCRWLFSCFSISNTEQLELQ